MIDNTEAFDRVLISILRDNNIRFGLGIHAIRAFAHPYQFRGADAEFVDRLEYLTEKGLVLEVPKTVGSNRAWKISDAGRRFADEHNL